MERIENRTKVQFVVDTEFVRNALKHWREKRLYNFVPPALAGEMDFGDGYSFSYHTEGERNVYPKKVVFQACTPAARVSGYIKVRPGRQFISIGRMNSTSLHEEKKACRFVHWVVAVFGEYNFCKAHRKTVEHIQASKPRCIRTVGDAVHESKQQTQPEKQDKPVSLTSSGCSKPFCLNSSEVAREGISSGRISANRKYVLESWPCLGYTRRNGTYVEPCIKHRSREYLS